MSHLGQVQLPEGCGSNIATSPLKVLGIVTLFVVVVEISNVIYPQPYPSFQATAIKMRGCYWRSA